MHEHFTDRARKVMQLAHQEAQRVNHEHIATEHILLGLVEEGSGVAAYVLKNLGVDLQKVRREVNDIMRIKPARVIIGAIPLLPTAKKVIEYATDEARNFGHTHVGTAHLLLGLIREQEGVAAHVLMNFGVNLESSRKESLSAFAVEK